MTREMSSLCYLSLHLPSPLPSSSLSPCRYCLLADYEDYIKAQDRVSEVYQVSDPDGWEFISK